MKISTEPVRIEGPLGRLEAVLDRPQTDRGAILAVNCHPHSLHGGSLSNKVTHTLSKAAASLGIPSLRFNFRGVGESEGVYDEGRGEQLDLLACVAWMQQTFPNRQLIVSGFSFGAYVSLLATSNITPDLMLSVAPPLKRFDFTEFVHPNCVWTVLMGDADELVDYAVVADWVNHLTPAPELVTFEGASHFFHGRLIELRDSVEQLICAKWPALARG